MFLEFKITISHNVRNTTDIITGTIILLHKYYLYGRLCKNYEYQIYQIVTDSTRIELVLWLTE